MSRRITISILLILSTLQLLNAQVLYEVSGRSARHKSYILATNKMVDQTFLDTIPNVFVCFGKCTQVITEFAMEDYEAINALRQAALLPDSIRLSNFYTDEEYQFIDNALQLQVGMGLDKLARMKPSYLTEMIRDQILRQWLEYDEERSMEAFFETVAQQRNIPVHGLDNIGETMYMLFDREPFHWQCKQLKQIIEYPEREIKQEREIKALYLSGRLNDIAFQVAGPNNQSTISFSDYQVYCQRNQQWVKRLHPYLREGRCFITLNAIYLGGDKGLLQQLRAAGYRIRPVNRLGTRLTKKRV